MNSFTRSRISVNSPPGSYTCKRCQDVRTSTYTEGFACSKGERERERLRGELFSVAITLTRYLKKTKSSQHPSTGKRNSIPFFFQTNCFQTHPARIYRTTARHGREQDRATSARKLNIYIVLLSKRQTSFQAHRVPHYCTGSKPPQHPYDKHASIFCNSGGTR